MSNTHSVFGFDIRTPGMIGGNADDGTVADQPFRPRGALAGPWTTFDKYINPSVFVAEEQSSQPKREDALSVPKNANIGFDLFALWDSLSDMIVHYPRDGSAPDAAYAYASVDLRAFGVGLPKEDTVEVLVSRQVTPAMPSEEWPLLGFDIVSPYFISALAGYRHSQTDPKLVHRTLAHINSLGLLAAGTALEDLAALLQAFDEELGEDPFFLVAIYLLWDSSQKIARALDR